MPPELAVLTAEERAKIRHHMGFMNVAQTMAYVLGVPAAVEQSFLIEGAMNKILVEALPLVRQHINILDSIEQMMISNYDVLLVESLGEIKTDQRAMLKINNEYDRWRQSLGNLLGVVPNPFDKRRISRTMNVPVFLLNARDTSNVLQNHFNGLSNLLTVEQYWLFVSE